MGTVGASPALGSLVDLDAADDQVTGVEALGVGVGLGVLEQVGEEAGGLLGPAGLADTPLLAWAIASAFPSHCLSQQQSLRLTLRSASLATGVPPHRDDLGLGGDIVEEGQGALQLHAVDGLGGLVGVLEGDTQVRAAGAGALSGRDFLSGVADLHCQLAYRESSISTHHDAGGRRMVQRCGSCDVKVSGAVVRFSLGVLSEP